MTDGTASLPFYASDNPPDIHHPAFDFTMVAYVQAPVMIYRVTDPPDTIAQRKANDEAYRRTVALSVWNRFSHFQMEIVQVRIYTTFSEPQPSPLGNPFNSWSTLLHPRWKILQMGQ